jgi:putative ABC transport system ATP-binding protein
MSDGATTSDRAPESEGPPESERTSVARSGGDHIPAFEVRDLTRDYPGNVRALDDVNLSISRGETVAVTGPSGCGKSTLLHLLASIDRPSAGHILADGRDLSTIRDLAAYRRHHIGLVFQFHDLLPQLPVVANLEMPMFGTGRSSRQRRRRAQELLQEVDLSFATRRLPRELSGGERQRVAIARALVNDPAVLLADEPTGSLDSASTGLVLDLFRRLRRSGKTIIIITHSAEVAAVADRVVHMRDGRVVDDEGGQGATTTHRAAEISHGDPAHPNAASAPVRTPDQLTS